MRVRAEELGAALGRKLAPVYLVYGDEVLLVDEACDAVRDAARANAFDEREMLIADKGFDWNRLNEVGQSMSLFSQRRILELRLPTGKPGDAGSRAIQAYCERPPEDTLLLVRSSKIDRKTQSGKWFRAIDEIGVTVPVYTVEREGVVAWARERLGARRLNAGPGVAEMLAYRYEGNLLALSQEIDKLALLFPEGRLVIEDLEDMLADGARFDVFTFVDTCLAGNGPLAARMLAGLRAEGVSPVLVLWALAREIRAQAAISAGLARGENEGALFSRYGVWAKRQGPVRKAIRRHNARRWLMCLQSAARIDLICKGREAGDAWQALELLGLYISGVRPGRARAAC